MKTILVAAALTLVGATSGFAGGVAEATVQSVDCALDANNNCIVVAGPASSGGLLLGGLGGPGVLAGVAILILAAVATSGSSTNGTN